MKMSTYSRFTQIVMLSFILGTSATSWSQTNWEKHANNPVLNVGSSGAWDSRHVFHHEVHFDGTTYKMWYTGIPGESIGLATSSDGINWSKFDNNPVMTGSGTGVWDSLFVGLPVIIQHDTTYKMWYNGGRAGFAEVGYATSGDGITWSKSAENPIIKVGAPGSWESLSVIPCEVIFDGTSYTMWYAGVDQTFTIRIGYVTSPDGINWTRFAGNPIFEPGETGSWDDRFVYTPDIVFDGTTYHMWYMGNDGETVRIGYATSADGISWDKDSQNPILNVSALGNWDDTGVGHPRVILDEIGYQMWFIGNDGGTTRIGYATAPNDMPPTSISEHRNESSPGDFSLAQNYPNPFNPTTTINYKLPRSEFVKLSIYNAAGQVITTLVNEPKNSGLHSVQWDATNLASGIYFYRIKAGEYFAMNKALFLK